MILRESGSHRRVFGQFDDAVMALAEIQLAGGTHHAVRFNRADRRHLQHHTIGRHNRARHAQHTDKPGACIGRPAHNLQRRAVARIDGEDLQLVGIGVRRGCQDFGHTKARKALGWVFDAFNLKPDGVKPGGNLFERGVGIEKGFEPREREFHEISPP